MASGAATERELGRARAEVAGDAAGSPFSHDAVALAAVERLRASVPGADPLRYLPDVHPGRIPRHVAIIMDGNGRWARERGFPRSFGHRNGVRAVREVVEACGRLGVEALTLYSFSSENWKRPGDEVAALMDLCVAYAEGERERLTDENIRVRIIGERAGMPAEVLRALDALVEATSACTGSTLCLAINYGSRAEIVSAARSLAEAVRAGELDPSDIDDAAFEARLTTAGLPDPDLLVRTAGEMRLSNYLLWQVSYAELYVTDMCWPDFGAEAFHDAIRAFAARDRKFGGLSGAAGD
ncbi:MAG: isoprenyl transferase [Planctomycetota bacterium]